MRGGTLRRFTPTSLEGGGLIRNLVFPFLAKGFQSVGKKVIKKVQKRVRTAAKRKATQLVESVSKRAKRGVGDIFGH